MYLSMYIITAPVNTTRKIVTWAVVCLTVAVLALACLCGCGAKGPPGDIAELYIPIHRFNIDEERGVVRIFARMENTGDGHFNEIQVRAILRSAGGNKRGENVLFLEDIKPRETRDFSILVTSHGRTQRVELSINDPTEL